MVKRRQENLLSIGAKDMSNLGIYDKMAARAEAACTACHKLLADSETYGSINMPMCWDCHSSAMFDGDAEPQEINADMFAADAEPQPVRVFVNDDQRQESAGQLRLL